MNLFCRMSVAVLLLAVAASLLANETWPQFRGPDGAGTAPEADPPVTWGADQNIRWQSPLPGRGASSPVVWNDRIFLTAYTGYGISEQEPGDKSALRLHTLCFNRADGKLLWNRDIEASNATQEFKGQMTGHGYATGTPATDGEAVYTFFGVSGLVAYDFSGKELWRQNVGDGTAGFGSASSPVIWNDLVFINASIESDTLFAFDKKTGKEVWKHSPVNRSWSSPCIAEIPGGETELVMNQKDRILGLDPQTGKLLWTCDAIDDYIVPVPIDHEGIVYCFGGRQNRCTAVKLGGRGDVTESHKLWQVNVGANVTSPVYFDGRLYWASDRGIENCLDASNGDTVYRERLPTSERVYASIVRAGKQLYVTLRDAGVLVLAAGPEYRELAKNEIMGNEDLLNASPAVAGDTLLLRTDSMLYCIGK